MANRPRLVTLVLTDNDVKALITSLLASRAKSVRVTEWYYKWDKLLKEVQKQRKDKVNDLGSL